MVMEAMRLSLVEHEEQQRREAANRAQNASSNPDAALVSGDASVPNAILPSVTLSIAASEPGSRPYTPTPSAPPTTTATTTFVEPSTIIAQGRSSSSYSVEGPSTSSRPLTPAGSPRRRTPSPANQHPSDSLQPGSESSSPWHRRPSNSRPFSTIAAAMSATSAATAILKAEDTHSRDDNAVGISGNSSTPAAISSSTTPPVSSSLSISPSPSSRNVPANSARPQMSIETESYASSIFSLDSIGQATSPYDVLGSSPDSEFSREPLLGRSGPGTPTIPDPALPEVPWEMPSRAGEE
jgi:hypothetical protein